MSPARVAAICLVRLVVAAAVFAGCSSVHEPSPVKSPSTGVQRKYSCSQEGRERLAAVNHELGVVIPDRFNWWEWDDCDDLGDYTATFEAEGANGSIEKQLAHAQCRESSGVWRCPWKSAGDGHEVMIKRGDARAEWVLWLS